MNEFFARFRILPLLVLVAMLAFAVRIGETVMDVRDITAEALAQEDPAAGDKQEAKPAEEPAKGAAKEGEAKDVVKPAAKTEDSTLPEVWADPNQQDMADSPEQMKLLEDLGARRQQLDKREKALESREALMKASEKQIDTKIGELTELKKQIEELLGQQEKEQNSKIGSLVKIYEGMKAKEAAAIFNQMDMNILIQVVSNMSERKSAPIIASMDTAKANELTVRLTEMNRLPDQKTGGFMGANTSGGPAPTTAPAGSASLPGLDALGQP